MENKNNHKGSTAKLSKDFEDKLHKKLKHSFFAKSVFETVLIAFLSLSKIFVDLFKVLFVNEK